MKRLIYISIILASASVAAQQKTDVLTRRLCHSSLETNVATWRYGNPALMKDRFASSLTTIDAFWRYDSQQEARLIEEGDGSNRAGIEAKAYVKKGSNDIWGEAGYDFGQRRNVMLNESSDYQTVYPYVTADLVGGDLHEENYRFSGGFAHTLKGGVTLGAFAGYNALLAYRTVDPRPRNLTSDLDFAAGMRWRWLGVALKAGKYKQTNVVKFYNETFQPTVYHATGLGTDYFRFRGSNTNTYYNGRNFGIQADAASALGKITDAGIHVAYDYFGFDKIISSLNELPMASVAEHRFNAAAHILTRFAATNTFAVEAEITRTQRDGNENIFGEAENNIYPEIASLTMFRRSTTKGSLCLAYEHTLDNVRIQARATGGYASDRWRYTEPERLMEGNAGGLARQSVCAVGQSRSIRTHPHVFKTDNAGNRNVGAQRICRTAIPTDGKQRLHIPRRRASRLRGKPSLRHLLPPDMVRIPICRLGQRLKLRGDHWTRFLTLKNYLYEQKLTFFNDSRSLGYACRRTGSCCNCKLGDSNQRKQRNQHA